MAKTTSKNKKPATAGRRKPTQLDRIEKMLDNVWGVMEKNTIGLKDVGQRLRTIDVETTRHLVAIQADLSLLKSGASFMQELYRATQQEEQGLEDGDYTDASKEVADALTAMGWSDFPGMKSEWRWFEWYKPYDAIAPVLIRTGIAGTTPKTNAEFLSRARVTAKKLGKAKEEEQKLALLTFGTRVEYEGDKGWKVAMDMPSPDGTYAIVKEGHARMGWTKASQLTIID